MGKLLFWIVVAVIGYLAWRFVQVSQRRSEWAARKPESSGGSGEEAMRRCEVCGIHLPESEAVSARGHYYCCVEHRDEAGRH